MPNKETRMNPTRFINALEAGGKNTLSVAVACGVAGIIAGVVTMTGLGQLLISAIVGVAGDRVIVALFLTMLTCIVLGMGVPTTANYIIMATTCAPILVNGMGINKIAANMFVFYFGIVADITPPLSSFSSSAVPRRYRRERCRQGQRCCADRKLWKYSGSIFRKTDGRSVWKADLRVQRQ